MSNQWQEFVQLFGEKNQHLSKKQVLQQAKKPFQLLKQYYEQIGGGITINSMTYYAKNGILDLTDKRIGDKGAKVIAKYLIEYKNTTTITEIVLIRNNIGNDGAEALAEALSALSEISKNIKLDLRYNHITDKGAAFFQKFSKLINLDYNERSVDFRGF